MPFGQVPAVVAAYHHHLAVAIGDDAARGENALEARRQLLERLVGASGRSWSYEYRAIVSLEKFYYIRGRKLAVGVAPHAGAFVGEVGGAVLVLGNDMERFIGEIYDFVSSVVHVHGIFVTKIAYN